MTLPTDYTGVLSLLGRVDVQAYGRTRNYLDGAVSRLSPYLSRGVLTLPQVRDAVLSRHSFTDAYRFIYELAWREYFQRMWWEWGDRIFEDFKQPQHAAHAECLQSVLEGSTGIEVLDRGVQELYATGYLHNHVRMYLASVVCNIGRAHWRASARWMYYHLLDGDLASNMLSWQWVAGTFSAKKYYCNQDNINQYSRTSQHGTFLDCPYEVLPHLPVPDQLKATGQPELNPALPASSARLDPAKPLLLYNSYALDPLWRKDIDANRVLLLEPSHFQRFPVSGRVMNFVLALAKCVPGIQVMTAEVADIPDLEKFPGIFSKAHPAFGHYPGVKDEPVWMFPEARLGNSFTAFWKSCEKTLNLTTV